MKTKLTLMGSLVAVAVLALAVGLTQAQGATPPPPPPWQEEGNVTPQAALGTAFTYQGQLKKSGNSVSDTCDFQFSLWDAVAGGSQIGTTQNKAGVSVSDGYFTIPDLDFGTDAFDGNARWLQIAVACTGDPGYTTLSPRQPLTAAPYALFSKAAPWSGLTGVPSGFADNTDNDTTYTAGTGLTLTGNQFNVNTATVQARVTGTCSSGNAIRVINADGTVACEPVGGGDTWSLTGNSGTAPGTNFLGTTDNQALEFKVKNERILRLEPSNNLIGGSSYNSAGTGTVGATIGGGGSNTSPNTVTGNYGTVGGGFSNTVGGFAATVGGGRLNNAGSQDVAIGGGAANSASGQAATIAGGNENIANGYVATISGGGNNTALGDGATVGGGMNNTVVGGNSVIGGGAHNTISATMAVIGGGESNLITGTASYAAIAGGYHITVTGQYAAVGGGNNNTASAEGATIGGGSGNTASDLGATVGGGGDNTANGWNATVAGGGGNTASNTNATVGGGYGNVASGGDATVAGGRQNTAGYRAAVGGGQNNSASGNWAAIGGGRNNSASSPYAAIPGGYQALADHYGQMAYASGAFASAGDAQNSVYVLRNTTSGATLTELFLDGITYRLTIASGRTVAFDILVVGRSDGGESAGYHFVGAIENVGGATSLIGTVYNDVTMEDDAAWAVTVDADDTNDALRIRVQGGSGDTVRWVAVVRTVEVSW